MKYKFFLLFWRFCVRVLDVAILNVLRNEDEYETGRF